MRALTRLTIVGTTLLLGALACGASDTSVHLSVTDQSIVGPEVHVIVENRSDQEVYFWVKPMTVMVSADRYAACTIPVTGRAVGSPIRAWDVRREAMSEQGGLLAARGWGHRVFALPRRGGASLPCVLSIEVATEHGATTSQVVVSSVPQAGPTLQTRRPRSFVRSVVENDIVDDRLLARVLFRNLESVALNVAILRREIHCSVSNAAAWDYLQDVPQGLATGPGSVGPEGWIAFVGVVRVIDASAAEQCTIEVELGYEAYPTVYLSLQTLSFGLKPSGRLVWVDGPKDHD